MDKITTKLILEVGRQYNYRFIADPDFRNPMPLRMLQALGFVDAAEELSKNRKYPR